MSPWLNGFPNVAAEIAGVAFYLALVASAGLICNVLATGSPWPDRKRR